MKSKFSVLSAQFTVLVFLSLIFTTLLGVASPSAFAQVPGIINYQGRVTVGGTNFNGTGQFKFALVNNGASQTYWSNGVNAVSLPVTKGLYSVLLGDTGMNAIPSAVFTNSDVRLRVWFNGEQLAPDQRIAAVGYAMMAASVPSNSVTSAQIQDGAIANADISVSAAIADTKLATISTVGKVADSALSANVTKLGATIESAEITDGTIGTADIASIDGGKIVGGDLQARRLKVGGGHTLSGDLATIAGGTNNTASGNYSAVGGGGLNTASGGAATVGGGYGNTASDLDATVGGGALNEANDIAATVGGGTWNTASGGSATVGGGYGNTASGLEATVGGGYGNTASGLEATVGGGGYNLAAGLHNTVGGGSYNHATNDWATIAGGHNNLATNLYATVGGGAINEANDIAATVGGGTWNAASGGSATVGGGYGNTASGENATVGGGRVNTATGGAATVGGGSNNTATADYAAVGGGYFNSSSGVAATVGGGRGNHSDGYRSTIGGGYGNVATNNYSTVPGGYSNTAAGDYSFAAGQSANATNDGAFVWSSSFSTGSWGNYTFTVRAHGGARFYTASGTGTGVQLSAGGNSWGAISDRNVKENFQPVNVRALLAKVAALPVTTWNLKSQPATIRHIGAMAQDFAAAFGVGEDDRHITTSDADGVALAAIQGLYEELTEYKFLSAQVLKARDERIADLEKRLADLERRLIEGGK
jgi:hypothetical protein